ncbi:MAG: ATP synthase subunit I [Planctomycetes bacterium]|nr:ATP synthase subunit I [Planctomycetota bacterium]
MTDPLTLAWALATGVVLGAVFFGGLWWTVRRAAACPRPALLFLTSFLLRASLALAGLYFVSAGHWDRLLACLLGFVIARLLVTKLTGTPVVPRSSPAKEPGHAS